MLPVSNPGGTASKYDEYSARPELSSSGRFFFIWLSIPVSAKSKGDPALYGLEPMKKEQTFMSLSSRALRQSFLTFVKERGHALLPSASLVSLNDPRVLFTSAGMHPLVPYLLGQTHPDGPLLASIQKCLRTNDIEEVGDQSHLTFFEMLGFWSLDNYWQEDSLAWTFEWFTRVLGLDPERLAVTVFAGDQEAPGDQETAHVWLELGIPAERIYALSREDNWWPGGEQAGPCGPDSEIFYDTRRPSCGALCRPGCSCGRYVEIGNNVFMQYNLTPEGKLIPLVQRNVDVGIGLERLLCVLAGCESVYETDLFLPIIECIEAQVRSALTPAYEQRLKRILADHLRAATFVLAAGVTPSSVTQGYVCRRLLRRAICYGHELALPAGSLLLIVERIIACYREDYGELELQRPTILHEIQLEEERFARTLQRGLREFQRLEQRLVRNQQVLVEGQEIFRLFDTFGFPPSLTTELAQGHGLQVDLADFQQRLRVHQERSRLAEQARFTER